MLDVQDVWAEALVGRLLEEGHLELSSNRSRPAVVSLVASHLGRAKLSVSALAEALVDHSGVGELSCDDDTLRAIVEATEPNPEEVAQVADPPASNPPAEREETVDLSGLEPELRDVVERAAVHASAMGHLEVTLDHVLHHLLQRPAIVELARRRGGDPEAALAACSRRISREGNGTGDVGPDRHLAAALEQAKDDAARLVRVADLAIAAMRPRTGAGDASFLMAFEPKPATPLDEPDEEDVDVPPTPAYARGPGALAMSAELVAALALHRGEAERHADRFRLGEKPTPSLSARLVAAAEREIDTSLPDDFWAVLALRVPAIAALGIGASSPEAEPAPASDVCETVLAVASGAEAHIDDDLVAIAELFDSPDGASLCVKRGVPYAQRNSQEVYRVDDEGRRSLGTFGAFIARCARETCEGKSLPVDVRPWLRQT